MNKSDLENSIKKKMDGFRPEPPAGVWAEVQKEIPQYKASFLSTKMAFLIGGSAIVLVGLSILLYTANVNQKDTSEQKVIEKPIVPIVRKEVEKVLPRDTLLKEKRVNVSKDQKPISSNNNKQYSKDTAEKTIFADKEIEVGNEAIEVKKEKKARVIHIIEVDTVETEEHIYE